MPVYQISKIYKKLLETDKMILLFEKKSKTLKRVMNTDAEYKSILTKASEYYTVKSIGDGNNV